MSNTKTKATSCRKDHVLLDAKVVVEPSYRGIFHTEEHRIRDLESWAKELMEFFRDHRSQDVNDVRVEREYEDQCSACGHQWEEIAYEAEGGKPAFVGCGYCGVPVEVVR